MRRTFLSAFALAAGFAMTGPAFAHARLERAVPDGKATLALTLDSLKLFFSEGLVIALSGVKVTDAGQHPVQTGTPVLAACDDREMIVPLPASLPVGKYTVLWHAVASDGHRAEGSYTFAVSH
ncbi:copper homeostasis periplasmic binding protein CopC [Ferrovibrio xuzhouensis]|uniref:Copper homeostasis periplasmic binding protein CopC n=1 Tax=Ferrovibrio xuzhouensis TaxID=1576914 RepID=A0ABV7VHD4_9PROT